MPQGLTKEEVMECEEICRAQVYNRFNAKQLRKLADGSFDLASLSFKGQQAWQAAQLAKAAKTPKIAAQGDIFWSPEIAALSIPASQKDVVQRRMDLCHAAINGKWHAMGFHRKRDYWHALAEREMVGGRSLERWIARLKPTITPERKDGDPRALLDRAPGPHPGWSGGSRSLEGWMANGLSLDFVVRKLTVRQCYDNLISETRFKQESNGWRVAELYPVPSYRTCCQFLANLSPTWLSMRDGPDAMKAAAGYIDRSYKDLPSLGQVEVDEWITDALFYDDKDWSRVGRGYLLTFLDTRSKYPLTWVLIEKNKAAGMDKKRLEQAEMELFVGLIQSYGIPGKLYSDRGRFRGGVWGGQPDSKFVAAERESEVAGILDRLEIGRNMPREHNPRASRLERTHGSLAHWARTLSEHGWVGADTKQRKMTDGDRQVAEHREWLRGKRPTTPLLSRSQMLAEISQFMEEYRAKPSQGTDMNGAAPARVFEDNKPLGGFRQVSSEALAWATAEHFEEELIESGGIIQTPDKRRYSHPVLLLVQGERRECVRLRTNKSFISVLPSRKGEEIVFAEQRNAVGTRDREALADACELQAQIRKVLGVSQAALGGSSEPLAGARGSDMPEAAKPIAPRSSDAIPYRDFFEPHERETEEPEPEIAATAEQIPEEKPMPSLFEYDEPTVESL